MKNQTSTITHHRSVGGFTLVECLIGLAISAVLLAAVAVAFQASVTSYVDNEDMFWTINNARGALSRMTTQIRNAGYEFAPGELVAVDPSEPSHRCSFRTPDGGDFTFEFSAANRTLSLIDNTAGAAYILCNDVADASFIKTPTDDGDSRSVQISLTIDNGGARRTLSAAAVVRRNLGS